MTQETRNNHYEVLRKNLCFLELHSYLKTLKVRTDQQDKMLTDVGSVLNRERALGANALATEILDFINGDLKTGGVESPAQNETNNTNEQSAE